MADTADPGQRAEPRLPPTATNQAGSKCWLGLCCCCLIGVPGGVLECGRVPPGNGLATQYERLLNHMACVPLTTDPNGPFRYPRPWLSRLPLDLARGTQHMTAKQRAHAWGRSSTRSPLLERHLWRLGRPASIQPLASLQMPKPHRACRARCNAIWLAAPCKPLRVAALVRDCLNISRTARHRKADPISGQASQWPHSSARVAAAHLRSFMARGAAAATAGDWGDRVAFSSLACPLPFPFWGPPCC
ncbi:hypothetical protein BT67DRAFT_140537 [Trichocladium antarcticum]|uniref:Uncharacterized protein n=1 Tax=Trichocladium antarcticum TaxID=1450529 RepID=A0AAN6UFW8_9PEZI|nr:hypothetical protein BT67DRAFT_140537 [Trichocladium antarcticum]